MSSLLKKEKGFTLIEIVLVLAIAGLIMIIVFLAVSGAQKSRRDTQRKQDLSRIEAQLESFASNDNGLYPSMAGASMTWAQFYASTYITGSNLNSPLTGGGYSYQAAGTFPASGALTVDDVYYQTGKYCDGTANGRAVSVEMGLEQGDVCRDNK